MITYKIVHKAGKFSAPASQLYLDLERFTRDQHFDFIAVTEIGPGNPARGEQLGKFTKRLYDWFHSKGLGASETGQMWRDDKWVWLYKGTRKLTDETYMQRSGRERAPITASFTIHEHRQTGLIALVTEAHLPSSVDGRKGFGGKLDRVRTYRAVIKGWRREVRRLRKEFQVDDVIVLGDFNLDARKLWVRAYLGAAWGLVGLRSCWTRKTLREQIRGTHGDRVIDHAYYTHGIHVRPWIGPLSPASDHRPLQLQVTSHT